MYYINYLWNIFFIYLKYILNLWNILFLEYIVYVTYLAMYIYIYIYVYKTKKEVSLLCSLHFIRADYIYVNFNVVEDIHKWDYISRKIDCIQLEWSETNIFLFSSNSLKDSTDCMHNFRFVFNLELIAANIQ